MPPRIATPDSSVQEIRSACSSIAQSVTVPVQCLNQRLNEQLAQKFAGALRKSDGCFPRISARTKSMLTPGEIKQKEMIPPRKMLQMNIGGVFFVLKMLLSNLGTFKMLKNPTTKNVYVRPTPTYTIPPYSPEMKSCNSEEKYLRPTCFVTVEHQRSSNWHTT